MPDPTPVPGDEPAVTDTRRFGAADWLAFALLTIAGFAAIGWAGIARWRLGPGPHPLVSLLLLAVVLVILVNQQGRWALLVPMRRPRPMQAPAGLRVAVVTTFVPGGESIEMLEETLRAMVAMRYPHDTWLLDEGDDPAAIAACHALGVRHFSRRGRPAYQQDAGPFRAATKHGNYNAWLEEAGFGHYDVLAAFDPDHVPTPRFLEESLGYFRDGRIAYVQSAQAFYNQATGLVARGAAEETYAYFSAVQMAGYGLGFPIIMGSHNVHRMAALRQVGGFAAHDADDLLLTLQYRAAGWQGVYLPTILARGLTPVDWRSYLVQQQRWARSVLDLKLRHRSGYADRLPLRTRVASLLHGLNFLHRSLAYAILIVLLVLLLATGSGIPLLAPEMRTPLAVLLATLGTQELFRQRFYLDWRREAGLHWRAALLGFAKWPWFLLALLEVVTGRRPAYQLTWKTARAGGYPPFVAWHLGLVAVVLGAWAVGGLPPDSPVALIGFGIAGIAGALAVLGLRPAPRPFTPGQSGRDR